MGQAFTALFSMLSSFFRAGDNLGRAAENLTAWAEASSGVFKDEAEADRALKVQQNAVKRAKLQAELDAAQ